MQDIQFDIECLEIFGKQGNFVLKVFPWPFAIMVFAGCGGKNISLLASIVRFMPRKSLFLPLRQTQK